MTIVRKIMIIQLEGECADAYVCARAIDSEFLRRCVKEYANAVIIF